MEERYVHICYINTHTKEYISCYVNSLFTDRMLNDLNSQGVKSCMFSNDYWRGDEWTENYLRKQTTI